MEGWIKLHRRIEDWKRINDLPTLRLWIYILDHARHEDGNWNDVPLKAGQMVIGRKGFCRETGISEQTYRTSLRRLKDDGTITTKATNQYTIVTVENWGFYQMGEEKTTSESTSVLTSNQPATNQQLTTNKNVKNEKNGSSPQTPKGGYATTTTVESLVDHCMKYSPYIINSVDDPTIRGYFNKYLGWGLTMEDIAKAIDIVGYVGGGKTSLDRIARAMDTQSTSRLKRWEIEGWKKLDQQRNF